MPRREHHRFYDPAHRRLVYLGEPTSDVFWDARWQDSAPPAYSTHPSPRNLVVRETRRFLAPGSVVLEGGCGWAAGSWRLHCLGYRALAVDYAKQTLTQVGRAVPEVRPVLADVEALPLAAGSCDGYWSMGVIEHAYDGYGAMAAEMHRVLRRGGVLFLAFPALSPLRRIRAALRLYPAWQEPDGPPARFYQFALPWRDVTLQFTSLGFELLRSVPFLGVTGLRHELGRAGEWLDRASRGRSRPLRVARGVLDALLRGFSHHCRLLILRKA